MFTETLLGAIAALVLIGGICGQRRKSIQAR